MSAKNRIRIKICGNEFTVTSDDSEEYMLGIGKQIDNLMRKLLDDNPSMSIYMAAVFTAMDFCDEAAKSKETADNLRAQIKDYVEEAAKSRMEAEEANKKIIELNREIQQLRIRTGQKEFHK